VFGLAVLAATSVVVAVGVRTIKRHKETLLAPYRPREGPARPAGTA
jgi:hypothetical protein